MSQNVPDSLSTIEPGSAVHFIAVGGSVMHNLALALHRKGCTVTGSDDVIRNPAKDRLAAQNLLPESEGWFPAKITPNLKAVILGMHAKTDNPELLRAQELNIPVLSFPELILQLARNQQRIVIAGSHGKTSTTAILMHALQKLGVDFDYLVGASVPGFEHSIRISSNCPIMLIEGDEYPASPLDLRPKALVYEAHILVVTGIHWDHINVYPTEESYLASFADLLTKLTKAGVCVYNKDDRPTRELATKTLRKEWHESQPYSMPNVRIPKGGKMEIKIDGQRMETELIGRHNASNLAAAWQVCNQLAINLPDFLRAAADFKGAGLRLETWHSDDKWTVLRDFAHAPSKVSATVEAVAEHFRDRPLIAVLELHTFSSLNADFLPEYRSSMKKAKSRIVFVNRETLAQKGMPQLTESQLIKAFRDKQLIVVFDRDSLLQAVREQLHSSGTLLLMSSGGLAQISKEEWMGLVGK